jgi:hypothetical protein
LLQWAWAGSKGLPARIDVCQANSDVLGDFSHTSPVSRSSTASLLKFESTMNRVLEGSVWSHDGVA